jgi:hypothetical protein
MLSGWLAQSQRRGHSQLEDTQMTRKSKLKSAAKPSKSRLGSIGYMDDEHFNWLHSMRTSEEKKRDKEIQKREKRTSGAG